MVLVILAVIWAAVLIPPALRNRAEGRPSDSITAFRRQLAVLDRSGPRLPRSSRYDLTAPVRGAQSRVGVRPAAVSRASLARHETRRRRRDVLVALLAVAGATLLVGAVPTLRWVWVAHVIVDVLLVAYVALLVRQRNLAAERALKVRFIHGRRSIDERNWARSESAWLAN